MRILITGSRYWSDPMKVWAVLDRAWAEALDKGEKLTVIHGDCHVNNKPAGADHHAHLWCEHARKLGFGDTVEEIARPADWNRPCTSTCYHKTRFKNGKRYCPLAGHLRNQEMVDEGADECAAFPLGDSRGTRDCMRRAKKAGIPVTNYGDEYA